MKCERCGKNDATTNIKTVVNGFFIEKNLCDFCAAAEGVSSSSQNGLAEIFSSMFGQVSDYKPKTVKKCPVCGNTFAHIAESGKVGCADCYKTFKNDLLPYLKRIQAGTKHIGKTPQETSFEKDNIDSLRLELKRLIEEERYEEAAVLRDKIKAEENQNG